MSRAERIKWWLEVMKSYVNASHKHLRTDLCWKKKRLGNSYNLMVSFCSFLLLHPFFYFKRKVHKWTKLKLGKLCVCAFDWKFIITFWNWREGEKNCSEPLFTQPLHWAYLKSLDSETTRSLKIWNVKSSKRNHHKKWTILLFIPFYDTN